MALNKKRAEEREQHRKLQLAKSSTGELVPLGVAKRKTRPQVREFATVPCSGCELSVRPAATPQCREARSRQSVLHRARRASSTSAYQSLLAAVGQSGR